MSNTWDIFNKQKWLNFLKYGGGIDIIILIPLALIGIALPDKIFDENPSLLGWYPGGSANLTTTYENTDFNKSFWIKDPSHNQKYVIDTKEKVNGQMLTILSGPVPFIYIIIACIILYFIDTRKIKYIWKEFITFCYVYVISMSITYWVTKAAKHWVSWPRPHFYAQCELNDNDPFDPSCSQEDSGKLFKIWKSFPSGHSSYMMNVGTIVFYWTSAKLNCPSILKKFNNFKYKCFHHTWDFKLIIQFIMAFPIFFALWVGFTRIIDHAHFPTDVTGGFIIGFMAGYVGHLSQYQWNEPYSKRLMLEDRKDNNKISSLEQNQRIG